MSRNFMRLLAAATSSLFSLSICVATPFSAPEVTTLQKYMHLNIATQKNMFNKREGDQLITSFPGAILASPSMVSPGFSQDYQFHWTRDAGITMREVLAEYVADQTQPQDRAKLKEAFINYINFEKIAQQQPSLPGEQTLGQPKFNINTTVWEAPWGRPQNDGPAIRSLALCEMARSKNDVTRDVIPLIQTDLNYVMAEWQQPNYDLWEEVSDTDHFFTKIMQQRALTCGANLLYFVDPASSMRYTQTANAIHQTLNHHWHEELNYITETINQLNYKGGGLNSAILLAVLYGNELSEAGYLSEWSVLDDRVMSTAAALREAFANEYYINQAHPTEPPLLGRYPGDKYDGNLFLQGNPWVITSAAIAEYYYSLAYVYSSLHKTIEITARNERFFTQLGISTTVGKQYLYGSETFNNIITTFIHEGDRYLATIKRYQQCATRSASSCLHFSEQIDANTGQQTSAKDLTWSYVSLLRAIRAREVITQGRH